MRLMPAMLVMHEFLIACDTLINSLKKIAVTELYKAVGSWLI